eukprot:TRINITY_DN9897_c0_g1_i1.p1 TRINITY_DN9897_c0_g1~~TRINITY_DN9897_c0_g1_i1.p1  ORF type:complete len:934 (-),score=180.99 TRINITY_DN9897_c0_g1_i1:49-2850(-)
MAGCAIMTWGRGGRFQQLPKQVAIFEQEIAQLAAGAEHYAILTANGDLLTGGEATCGQLGHDDRAYLFEPKQVAALRDIKQVSCGFDFTAALTGAGDMFTWGNGSSSQLGLRKSDGESLKTGHDWHEANELEALLFPLPKQVQSVKDNVVLQVACGAEHLLALVNPGEIWCWGSNELGQIGLTTHVATATPMRLQSLGVNVASIACGQFHSLVIMKNGDMFSFGANGKGQLGLGDTATHRGPQPLLSLKGVGVRQAACGAEHSLICADTGAVFSWGSSVANGGVSDVLVPTPVNLHGHVITHVRAGFQHSIAITATGLLFQWGDCVGSDTQPKLVSFDMPDGVRPFVVDAAGGFCFTVAAVQAIPLTADESGDAELASAASNVPQPASATSLPPTPVTAQSPRRPRPATATTRFTSKTRQQHGSLKTVRVHDVTHGTLSPRRRPQSAASTPEPNAALKVDFEPYMFQTSEQLHGQLLRLAEERISWQLPPVSGDDDDDEGYTAATAPLAVAATSAPPAASAADIAPTAAALPARFQARTTSTHSAPVDSRRTVTPTRARDSSPVKKYGVHRLTALPDAVERSPSSYEQRLLALTEARAHEERLPKPKVVVPSKPPAPTPVLVPAARPITASARESIKHSIEAAKRVVSDSESVTSVEMPSPLSESVASTPSVHSLLTQRVAPLFELTRSCEKCAISEGELEKARRELAEERRRTMVLETQLQLYKHKIEHFLVQHNENMHVISELRAQLSGAVPSTPLAMPSAADSAITPSSVTAEQLAKRQQLEQQKEAERLEWLESQRQRHQEEIAAAHAATVTTPATPTATTAARTPQRTVVTQSPPVSPMPPAMPPPSAQSARSAAVDLPPQSQQWQALDSLPRLPLNTPSNVIPVSQRLKPDRDLAAMHQQLEELLSAKERMDSEIASLTEQFSRVQQ